METFKVDLFVVDPCPQDKPWVGYARVSTKRQFDEGISVDAQEAEIKSYCEKNGIQLNTVYKEVASSKNISDRPLLKKILLDINTNKYAGIIAIDMSRITRSLLDQQIYIDPIGSAKRIKLTRSNYKNENEDDFTCHTINTMFSQVHRMRCSTLTTKALANRREQKMLRDTRYHIDYWLYHLEPVPKTRMYKFTPHPDRDVEYLIARYGYKLGLHMELIECLLYVWAPDKFATLKSRRINAKLSKHLHHRWLECPEKDDYSGTRLNRYSLESCIEVYDELIALIKKKGLEQYLWKIPEPVATRQANRTSEFQSKSNVKQVFMYVAWDKVVDGFPKPLRDAIFPYYLLTQIAALSGKYKKEANETALARPIHESLRSGTTIFGKAYDPTSGCLIERSDKKDR